MIKLLSREDKDLNKPFYKRPIELAVLLAFAALYIVITCFHEPWFDEAQAWQIARYSSLKEILFTVGHYEGHPFLWYLILAIPAKLGVPFEWGLKTIGFLISAATAYLIIYKAPFPRLLRCLLPFSSFVFYQYGIIVRPYGLMLLLFLLTALAFPEKDQHPWPFVILLGLQCLLNAYGMVLAGGIALCWVWDILTEHGLGRNKFGANNMKKGQVQPKTAFCLGNLFRDRRFLPLCALLVCAFLVLAMIYSYPDTYSAADDATNSRLSCLLVAFLTFLGDSLITTSPFFNADTVILQTASFEVGFVAAAAVISLVLAVTIACYSSKKNIKYFAVPYALFTVFSGVVYFAIHHIGILSVYILFWCWINADDENSFETGRILLEKIQGTEKDRRLFQKVGVGILCVCVLMNLYWSVGSWVLDIQNEYSYGRETSAFLKESGLDQLKAAAIWYEDQLEEDQERSCENINTVFTGIPTLILAYYDENFVYTFHNGENKGYTTYRSASVAENEENLALWRENGVPDVLLGGADVELLTDGAYTRDDYAPVWKMQLNYIFKGKLSPSYTYIYLRRDLLEEYGLEELETVDMDFRITDEIRERFENGESMESILEPFFKASGLLPEE